MKVEKFVLMHPFPQDSPVTILANDVARFYKDMVPETVRPKLGPHITLLPPFFAHPEEMLHLSKGLNIMKVLYGALESSHTRAKISGLGFFNNPENSVLILKTELPPLYRAVIAEYRTEFSKFATWVFPLLDTVFNPHVCIFEGKNVYRNLQGHIKMLPQSRMEEASFNLPPPTIMRKVEEGEEVRWEVFDSGK